MIKEFKTDSDEDVIFISEKSARKSSEITIDQAKRLALQRDIDQESQPKQSAKTLTSQRSVAVERPERKVKIKMEDEKNENLVKKQKKEKKQKKQNKNCTVDDGSLAGVKKEKKKVKRVEALVEEEQSWDGGGEKEKKKKKKKKEKIVTDSLNDANGSDVTDGNDEGVSKKKTKKKQLAEYESGPRSVQENGEEKRQRKEKKVKNKASQIQPENVKMENIEKEGENVPKKGKKEKNKILVESTEETEEHIKERKKKKNNTAEEVEISVMKKKKKAKLAENGVKLETPEGNSDEVEEVKVKKKKKKEAETEHKAATKEDEIEVETQEIKDNKKKNKAASGRGKPEAAIKEDMEEKDIVDKKKKDKSTKSEIVIEEGKTKSKKKGKKEKRRNALEVSGEEETEPKKKRKKANLKGEEPLILKCEDVEEEGQSRETLVTADGDTSKKSKRKKSSSREETQVENVCLETGAKKKKKKIKEEVEDQNELPQVEVVFLSEKTGNHDEVTINQERRQALQMEIDKASQPQKPAKPSGFGQWSTAQFDSSDQQQKFLRLMGGFKKGFQPAAENTGGANMALGKDGQQQLQQKLLGEFERAQSRRMDFSNRGAGLGFTAPSNKKFSIDINACRSVRFDN